MIVGFVTDAIFVLCDESVDDLAGDIGEPVASSLELEGQFFVVKPHQVKDGGMKIVYVDGVPDDVIAEVVGLAIDTWFYPAPGHPDGKAAGVVIAAIVLFGERPWQ